MAAAVAAVDVAMVVAGFGAGTDQEEQVLADDSDEELRTVLGVDAERTDGVVRKS